MKNKEYWYIFSGDNLLLRKEDSSYSIPELEESPIDIANSFEVTLPDGSKGIAASTKELTENLPEGFEWMRLRPAYSVLAEQQYNNAGKAFQLLFWDINSKFCPRCGTATIHARDIMKKCPNCGKEIFPHVSPAILVLIKKGEEVLLVRSRNFRGTFFGLVAGFVETGESLEECVRREVMEETGLTIKGLRYYGNQTWPYPSNLMVGFIAEYESGTIKLQDDELSAGNFFSRDNLPEIPTHPSLARRMIDSWINKEC